MTGVMNHPPTRGRAREGEVSVQRNRVSDIDCS